MRNGVGPRKIARSYEQAFGAVLKGRGEDIARIGNVHSIDTEVIAQRAGEEGSGGRAGQNAIGILGHRDRRGRRERGARTGQTLVDIARELDRGGAGCQQAEG